MMMAVTTGGNGVIMEKMTMVTIKIPMIPTTMTGFNMTMLFIQQWRVLSKKIQEQELVRKKGRI